MSRRLWIAQTWELAGAACRRLRGLGIDLGRHPSRLRIETIDSFNAWLATQLPIISGAGGRLTLIDNPRPLYEEAARRALLHDRGDNFGKAVERVLAVGDQRWSPLVDLVVAMLPQRDRWLPFLVGHLHAAVEMDEGQLAHVRARFDEDLGLLVKRELARAHGILGGELFGERLGPCLRAAARNLGGTRADFVPWQAEPSPLGADLQDLGRWRAVATVLLTGGGKIRKKVDKNLGFPPACAEKGVMHDLLEQLERQRLCGGCHRDALLHVAISRNRATTMRIGSECATWLKFWSWRRPSWTGSFGKRARLIFRPSR